MTTPDALKPERIELPNGHITPAEIFEGDVLMGNITIGTMCASHNMMPTMCRELAAAMNARPATDGLREALEFYAHPYAFDIASKHCVISDKGERARKALAATPQAEAAPLLKTFRGELNAKLQDKHFARRYLYDAVKAGPLSDFTNAFDDVWEALQQSPAAPPVLPSHRVSITDTEADKIAGWMAEQQDGKISPFEVALRCVDLGAELAHTAHQNAAAPDPNADFHRKTEMVYRAAHGLCYGTDWNKGNHAILHGYRQRLVDAVRAIDPGVPDQTPPRNGRVG